MTSTLELKPDKEFFILGSAAVGRGSKRENADLLPVRRRRVRHQSGHPLSLQF